MLLVPGKITFDRERYLGLKEENHNAEVSEHHVGSLVLLLGQEQVRNPDIFAGSRERIKFPELSPGPLEANICSAIEFSEIGC